MKVGIAGFSGCGKSTVFHWLTGTAPDPSKAHLGQLGVAEVPDARLDWLHDHHLPDKPAFYAKLEFLDTPGLMPAERRDNPRRLGILRDAGGLLVVLNGFSGGDLADELRRFREELLFADMEVVSARIGRLEDLLKKPRPAKQREVDQLELELLQRILAGLEHGRGAAALGLKDEEERAVRSFQLLTLKPELVFVNLGDDAIGRSLPPELLELTPNPLQAPAKLERELEELSAEDREVFMKDMNLAGFARDDVLRAIFYGMGQIVFFTIGDDECRAWPIAKGSTSVEGAAEVHTDLARGFVRAEVVAFADFQRVGSLKEAKSHGVYRLEGKTYVVQDGDVMHILASS